MLTSRRIARRFDPFNTSRAGRGEKMNSVRPNNDEKEPNWHCFSLTATVVDDDDTNPAFASFCGRKNLWSLEGTPLLQPLSIVLLTIQDSETDLSQVDSISYFSLLPRNSAFHLF